MNRIIVTALFLLFTASSSWGWSLGSDKFKNEVEKESEAVKLVRDVKSGGYEVMTTAELTEVIQNGEDVLIIDTMPYEASYKKEHVPNAKQFLFPIPDMVEWDVKETDGKTQEEFVALLGPDKDKKIIVYCGFVKCTRSHNGAMWAKKLGYTNVYRYPGGIFAWKGADQQVDKVE